MKPKTSLLEIKNVSKKFYSKDSRTPLEILNRINLIVSAGQKVAITGASGSGKSTLLYILGLLSKADGGQYFWAGRDLLSLNIHERAVFRRENQGFVFQNYGLLPENNVLENVLTALKYSGFSFQKRVDLADNVLEKVGLSGRHRHYPRELSGGECQRLGLARALVRNPKLLLADEPTGNLDKKTTGEILSLFENYVVSGGTLLIVTHNPELTSFCDESWILENGNLQKDFQGKNR